MQNSIKITIFTLLTAILALCFTGEPLQSQVTPFKFKVLVSVSCKDSITKDSIKSYVNRELRSLGDVQLVSYLFPDDAHFQIALTAVEPTWQNTGAKTGGIAIASMFLEKFDVKRLNNKISAVSQKSLNDLKIPLYLRPHLAVNTDDSADTEKLCKSIVISFDVNVLEPIRKLIEK